MPRVWRLTLKGRDTYLTEHPDTDSRSITCAEEAIGTYNLAALEANLMGTGEDHYNQLEELTNEQ